MRQTSRCMAAGPQPLTGRALGIVGPGQMKGQELGLALDEVSEICPSTAATRACSSCLLARSKVP